ncbi:MAG: hypothetical protein ACI3ZR_00100 [bacterium]
MGNEDMVNTLLQQNNLLIERLARIETKLELIVEEHAPCRNRISSLEAVTAEQSSSLKSAHHRIDEVNKKIDGEVGEINGRIYKILGLSTTIVGIFASVLTWALSR